MIEKLKASVARNPAAWVLFGIFLVAEYGNWEQGHNLRRVCEKYLELTTALPIRQLAAWQRKESDDLQSICASATEEPEPRD